MFVFQITAAINLDDFKVKDDILTVVDRYQFNLTALPVTITCGVFLKF